MPYHLVCEVSFSSNGERNRARNAISSYITNWNGSHPTNEDFTLVRLNNVTLIGIAEDDREVEGQSYPGLDFEYTTPSESSVMEAQRVIQQDIDTNAYLTIRTLSVNLD